MYQTLLLKFCLRVNQTKELLFEASCLNVNHKYFTLLKLLLKLPLVFFFTPLEGKKKKDYTRDIAMFPGYIIIISKSVSIFVCFLYQLCIPKIRVCMHDEVTQDSKILR